MKEFNERIEIINKGKKTLESLIKKVDNEVVLIFPENDEELINCILKYMYVLEKRYSFITIISSFKLPSFDGYTKLPYQTIELTAEEVDSITRYAYILMSPMLKIMSFKVSLSGNAKYVKEQVVGLKNITMDKIVYNYLLGEVGKVK